MTTKQKLEQELQDMREAYLVAGECEDRLVQMMLIDRSKEIRLQLNNMCYQCQEESRTVNEYFCSEKCNEAYYPLKSRKSVQYMQGRLKDYAKK